MRQRLDGLVGAPLYVGLLDDVLSQPRGNVRRRRSTPARVRVLSMPSETVLKVRAPRHGMLAVPGLVHGLPG